MYQYMQKKEYRFQKHRAEIPLKSQIISGKGVAASFRNRKGLIVPGRREKVIQRKVNIGKFSSIPLEELLKSVPIIEKNVFGALSKELLDYMAKGRITEYIRDLLAVMVQDKAGNTWANVDFFHSDMTEKVLSRIVQEWGITKERLNYWEEDRHQRKERAEKGAYKRIGKWTPEERKTLAIKKVDEETDVGINYLLHPVSENKDRNDYTRSYKYFYHATPKENLASIKERGLDPRRGGSGGMTAKMGKTEEYAESCRGKIHITDYIGTTDLYARAPKQDKGKDAPIGKSEELAVILRFPQAYLSGSRLEIDPYDKFTALTVQEVIPPEFLEVYDRGEWIPLEQYLSKK